METQQGIYVSPDNVRANRDREKTAKYYLIKYTAGLDAYSRGVAMIKAASPEDAEDILKKTGLYSSLSCLYNIKEIQEVTLPDREGIIIEDCSLSPM